MQAQGNPATIKEQMQQGLMGEYRQQAAKEMGVGPSEADTVARAQQGMPQGGQRTPQGAPQQMPQAGAQQMAQGVMSQAQPVKLAGGGIVAFQEGMRVGVPEEAGLFSQFSLPDMDAVRRAEERRKAERARAIAAGGDYPENITAEEAVEAINEALAEPSVKARRREEAAQAKADEEFELPSEDLAMLDEAMRPAAKKPAPAPATAPAEIQPAAGLAAVAQTPAKTSGEGEEPGIRELLMQKLRADIGRDPEAAGARRAAMIRRELGLDEGIATLADRKARREQAFQDMQPSRRDNLIDLLTAGGRGGITGVGVRDRQLRDAARERRMAYEDKLDDIENTSMELRRSIGTAAANEYSKAATRDLQTMNNAATVLQRMDVEDRQRVEADLTRKRQEAKLEIDRTNALGKLLGSTKTFAEAAEKLTEGISSISERIRDPYETRRALLEQRALGGDEQAKEDLKNLENTISLQIINDPEYIRLQTMLESLDTERLASQDQRAALAAGLRGVQVADVSDEDESLVASYEGR